MYLMGDVFMQKGTAKAAACSVTFHVTSSEFEIEPFYKWIAMRYRLVFSMTAFHLGSCRLQYGKRLLKELNTNTIIGRLGLNSSEP
jgi:hypothetical protein